MTTRSRSGFSLMEVLLATAILLGSTIVLVELASIGRHHANSAAQLAMAQRLCENKINEILAGVAPLESVESQPLETTAFDDLLSVGEQTATDPMWLHSVEIVSLDQPALVSVRVIVWPAAESDEDRRNAFSLVRWMRSPYQNEADQAAQPTFGTLSF